MGVCHRDLKPENFIFESKDSMSDLKVIDFGLSKVLLPGERSADPYGTLAYCSPEIIAKKPHTTKTDVWSLGIVLYTMLTRRMPFIANDEEQTKNNILYRNLNFD
jgi:cGMP-dependent protein kinase/serum/glucocorticoid-regulated kinase 2